MNITEQAVMAAIKAADDYYDVNEGVCEMVMEAALTAAAPYMSASARDQALEEAEKLCTEYARSFQKGLCHYGSVDKDAGRGRQEGHINAGNELAAAIRALKSQPVQTGGGDE